MAKTIKAWWIRKSNGHLVEFGRHIRPGEGVFSSGMPNPKRLKMHAAALCYDDEKPVRVEIREV